MGDRNGVKFFPLRLSYERSQWSETCPFSCVGENYSTGKDVFVKYSK